tara:strand:- start:928 stop:1233 length:306 start_codon:yes stop_codon:yes gene_type:complete
VKHTKETVQVVENILDKYKIDYKRQDDIITLITKLIPRVDGKGIKRRYIYDYYIGTGKWRSIRSDGTTNPIYYNSDGILDFLVRFFKDNIYNLDDNTKYRS